MSRRRPRAAAIRFSRAVLGGIWCAGLAFALLGGTPADYTRAQRIAILLILAVVIAWGFIVVLQYSSVGSFLSPHPGWALAKDAVPVVPRAAAYGQVPIAAVVPPLALTLALLTGLTFGSDEAFTQRIYSWVGYAGLAYAIYAVLAELTNPSGLLWREKTAYLSSVTGTFVNHSTAATFFGCVATIWYLRSLQEIRHRFDLTRWRDAQYLLTKLQNLEGINIGSMLAFLVLLATVFMTRSRAGILLSLGAFCLVTVLYFSYMIKSARRALILAVTLLVMGIICIELAGGQFSNEVQTRGLYDFTREQAWLSEFRMVQDHPWLGSGLGTFSGVFSAYRNPAGGVWGVIDHAHSTPMETLVEMGVPFTIILSLLWAAMLWSLIRASLFRSGSRFYVVAGTGILALGTLHSLVDFSLQIPGFSIVCCTLAGASLAQSLLPLDPANAGSERRKDAPAKELSNSQLSKMCFRTDPPKIQRYRSTAYNYPSA